MSDDATDLCPFGHRNSKLIERVSTAELVAAYREKLGIDIGDEFGQVRVIDFRECTDCALKFFLPAVAGSERMYAQLSAKHRWYYSDEKIEFERAARRILPGQRVLEVGCGVGAFAAFLAGCQYTGLEFNRDAIAIAKSKGLDVRPDTVEHTAKHSKEAFNVVCAFEVLEHVENPAIFITACIECLQPGGLLIFSVPNSDSYLGVQADDLLSMPPHHLTWWGEEAFWRLAKSVGLEMIAVEPMPMPLNDIGTLSRIVALNLLRRRLGDCRLFCFYGRRYELLRWAAKIIARFLLTGMYDRRLLPNGHSILAVLRRPG